MVKYNSRNFYNKKYYSRATKRQFNYIASNYLKYKVKGEFQFRWQNGITGEYNLTFDDILSIQGGNDFSALRHHFIQYKITGIAINITPVCNTNGDGAFSIGEHKAALGIMSINDELNFANVSRNPNSIALGKDKISKYLKINSAWHPTTESALSSMRLIALSDGDTLYGGIHYNMMVTMYITFKTPA